MGVAVLGQCALLPYLQFMPNGGGPVVLAALGAVMAFALLCIGVYELGKNARGRGFIERLGTVVMLLLMPQMIMWLAFRLKYPNFGWRFLAMMLVPLVAGVILGEALPARMPKGDYVPPPTLEITVGFAITALFLLGIALSGSASARSNLAWPDLPALREVAENANFTAS